MIVRLHAESPQLRLVRQVVDCLKSGGVLIYPTDSVYAIGTLARNKEAIEKILNIKGENAKKRFFTIMCPDISSIAQMTMPISNDVFKLMKRVTPGPVTFILKANSQLSKFVYSKRQTVGVRIPDSKLVQSILSELQEDMLISSSLPLVDGNESGNYIEEEELIEKFEKRVDMMVFGEQPPFEESTVLDVSDGQFEIIRQGKVELNF